MTEVISCPYCESPIVTEDLVSYFICLECYCKVTITKKHDIKGIAYHVVDDVKFYFVFENGKTYISVIYNKLPDKVIENILILDYYLKKPKADAIFSNLKDRVYKLLIFS